MNSIKLKLINFIYGAASCFYIVYLYDEYSYYGYCESLYYFYLLGAIFCGYNAIGSLVVNIEEPNNKKIPVFINWFYSGLFLLICTHTCSISERSFFFIGIALGILLAINAIVMVYYMLKKKRDEGGD